MSDLRSSERLLSDVLREPIAGDFRAGMLEHTLRLARRRRHFGQVRRAAAAVAVTATAALLLWHQLPARPQRIASPAKCYEPVHTRPLADADVVTTRPLSVSSTLASVATANIVLTSQASSPVHNVSDDELLALAPQPAALVRFASQSAELVFVKQDEPNESLGN